MNSLYQTDSFTQEQDRQFAVMADILTDAAKAKALIAYLDAKFGKCQECAGAPADFAAAVADYDANGLRYVKPGTVQAVYAEAVGE
jgi:hypothetical protein